jgi:hypothetical protein
MMICSFHVVFKPAFDGDASRDVSRPWLRFLANSEQALNNIRGVEKARDSLLHEISKNPIYRIDSTPINSSFPSNDPHTPQRFYPSQSNSFLRPYPLALDLFLITKSPFPVPNHSSIPR